MNRDLFFVGVKAVIMNDAGEILLTQQTPHTIVLWDIPGGCMVPGEDFLATLTRELREEIGLTAIGQPVHFSTVLSIKPIFEGDKATPLILVSYIVHLLPGATPQSLENGVNLSWKSPKEAALLIADKYPSDFCTALSALEVNN